MEMKDEFLSEEDLDLRNMSDEELDVWWGRWFELAQLSNEEDRNSYSHGVFSGEHLAVERKESGIR